MSATLSWQLILAFPAALRLQNGRVKLVNDFLFLKFGAFNFKMQTFNFLFWVKESKNLIFVLNHVTSANLELDVGVIKVSVWVMAYRRIN